MKHPTASADLAGIETVIKDDGTAFDRRTYEPMDGDALAGSNMARRVKLEPGTLAAVLANRRLGNDLDPRKPWTEPTVTECATTNRRPETLTIAGVDLPNPQGNQAMKEDELLPRLRACANGVGSFKSNQGDYGICDDAADLIQRQAAEIGNLKYIIEGYDQSEASLSALLTSARSEITELQGMLEEAIGPVRLVSELATMTDTECEFLDGMEVRDWARNKLDGDFVMPRMYGDEDRKRARDALFDRYRDGDRQFVNVSTTTGELVDIVAAALGLRRAS